MGGSHGGLVSEGCIFFSPLPAFRELGCFALPRVPSPDVLSYLGPKAVEPIVSDQKPTKL